MSTERPFKRCGLSIAPAPPTADIAAVWAALPASGQGYIVFPDTVETWPAPARHGQPFLEAEICTGATTERVILQDGRWHRFTWTEESGDDHEYVEEAFETPRKRERHGEGEPGGIRYRTYWTLREDAGIRVWTPVGARFVGFGKGDGDA